MNQAQTDGEDILGLGYRAGDRHYRAFVGPPEDYDLIAAMTFNVMTTLGLRQHHTLADIGCGSLRAGRLFIPYLNVGKYIGIEPNQWLVEEGIRREIGEDLVRIKQPRFYYGGSPAALEGSGATIDFAIAQSVFSHSGLDLIHDWLRGLSPFLAPTGALAATFLFGDRDFTGTGWVYPECVSFTMQSVRDAAAEAGLRLELLDCWHPRQTWVLLCREGFEMSSPRPPAASEVGSSADAERRLAMREWFSTASAARNDRRPSPRPAASATTSPEAASGRCSCCRNDTQFVETGVWLRNHYLCARCQSIPRFRAVNLTLDTYFAGWEHAAIHEFSPPNDFIRRHCPNYSFSRALEGVPAGMSRHGERCEDVERLTFADESFDIFVTQDVLEHVFDPGQAVREIMRVVKPGGAHVFTAPKHKGLGRTRQRARRENDTVVHDLEPLYHGDPMSASRELVTWDYGDDFESCLWNWCGYPTVTYVVRDRRLGLDGEYLDVFVTRKLRGETPPAVLGGAD